MKRERPRARIASQLATPVIVDAGVPSSWLTPGALQAIAMAVALRTAKREHPRARIASQLATPVLVNAGA